MSARREMRTGNQRAKRQRFMELRARGLRLFVMDNTRYP